MSHIVYLIGLLAVFATPVAAQTEFRSGERQVSLVELYTSEGCSSCPPADRWLGQLLQDEGLWSRFVPVAFHVDYWNYLGWEDRFAQADFAHRQRTYRRQGSVSGVYTPGVMVAGQEWRSWRRSVGVPVSDALVGNLVVRVDGGEVRAKFSAPADRSAPLVLHIAVLGFGLATPVHRGENRGRVLPHEFVVLAKESHELNDLEWQGALPLSPESDGASRYALAAWVSPADRQLPIQATGGWLPE